MGRLEKLRVFDPVLTNVAVDYKFPENAGYALFPIVPTAKRGNKITKFDKSAFILGDSRRATGAKRDRVVYGSDTVDLILTDRGLELPVDDREVEEGSDPNRRKILLGENAVNKVLGQVGLQYEYAMAAAAQNAANYGSSNKKNLGAGGSVYRWSDNTNSTPYEDIEAGKAAVRAKIGMEPNTFLISYDVWAKLKVNPKITAKLSDNDTQVLTVERLAEILMIPKIVIGVSLYTTAKAGAYTDMWTKTAILAYVPPNPLTLDDPSYGYTGRFTGYPKVFRYRDESASSEIVAVDDCQGSALTCADAGYLFYDAIA